MPLKSVFPTASSNAFTESAAAATSGLKTAQAWPIPEASSLKATEVWPTATRLYRLWHCLAAVWLWQAMFAERCLLLAAKDFRLSPT